MRVIVLAALAAVATLSTGCASIVGSKVQPVIVSTACAGEPVVGAQCQLRNSKGVFNVQSTPGVAMVAKASSDMAIECKNGTVPGAPDVATSHANRGMWGNLLIGGIIGFGVDGYTDMGWNYQDEYTVDMCRGMPARVADAIRVGAQMGAVAAAAPGNVATGMQTVAAGDQKWSYTAEQFAKQRQCAPTPRAVLNARGPATEVYTVACTNGDALMLRCTWGECKSI